MLKVNTIYSTTPLSVPCLYVYHLCLMCKGIRYKSLCVFDISFANLQLRLIYSINISDSDYRVMFIEILRFMSDRIIRGIYL